jgi:hypothetical protein
VERGWFNRSMFDDSKPVISLIVIQLFGLLRVGHAHAVSIRNPRSGAAIS